MPYEHKQFRVKEAGGGVSLPPDDEDTDGEDEDEDEELKIARQRWKRLHTIRLRKF
jgi:hypothetical protein